MDFGLKGKKALVLGASRGLGAACAQELAAEGAHVFAAARSVERIATGEGIESLGIDLSDAAAVADLGARMAEEKIDIIVNNGGGPPPGSAQGHDPAAWTRAFQDMAAPLIALTDAVLPGMKERRWGRVITIASSGVIAPIPNLALSNVVRSALVGWSKTLATEVAADGVTVNMVLPGRIGTDRVDQLDAARAKREGIDIEEVRRQSRATIPAGRYGEPEEFAAVVAFLASARASYVTGSMLRVDGGMIRNV